MGERWHDAVRVAQQDATRNRRRGVRFMDGSARALCVVGLTTGLLGCLRPPDAPIPPGYEALVESARSSVLGNHEGLFQPALAVMEVRCFADGGVVILFRQVGGPTPGEPAFAMRGQVPVVPDTHAWSGGYGDLDGIEEEIAFNFGDVPEVGCPPRAA